MKVLNTLAAIGLMTVVVISVKTVMVVNNLINGPDPKKAVKNKG